MKNFKFLMVAFLMFAFIIPVSAMPLSSVYKTEKSFKKENVIKATIVSLEIVYVSEHSSYRKICPQVPFYHVKKANVLNYVDKWKLDYQKLKVFNFVKPKMNFYPKIV